MAHEVQLRDKVAVVTGASSGIGAAIVQQLLAAGMLVVGLARRIERIDELRQRLPTEKADRLHALRCDVRAEDEVAQAFATISERYGNCGVLVNNAGCLQSGQLCRLPADQVRAVLETNVMGVVNCTRHAFAAMQAKAGEGPSHVILINSILGHQVPAVAGHLPALNIYPATKFALTAINEIYRQEFKALGTTIKVTSISPGLVDTEFISEQQKRFCGASILQPEDVARAVMFVLTQPTHVHVHELTIKPMGEMF